ncbi:MAG: porin family protein [Promethearchaeota archaeon]
MKKLIIICSLIILFSNQVYAGEFSSTGLKLGLNYSKFIGEDTPGKKVSNIPGFAIGGFLVYKINDTFSAQQELYLTTKGSRVNTVGDINQNNIFVYIQMPLLAKMTFLPKSRFRPFILCGPALSIKTLSMNFTGMLEDINPLDWGLIFRAGIEYWKISFEVSYDRSISNFDQSADGIDLKNQTISFIVGYSF